MEVVPYFTINSFQADVNTGNKKSKMRYHCYIELINKSELNLMDGMNKFNISSIQSKYSYLSSDISVLNKSSSQVSTKFSKQVI